MVGTCLLILLSNYAGFFNVIYTHIIGETAHFITKYKN